ncbi:MAG: cation diffusion facilitator family transporter [Thermodesulfobacteriota bacterium]|nr:cation diffusion facilitator family transporter [Thermodesulfobacteriota bacterium]
MNDPKNCVKAARLAIITATGLAILKVLTGIITGSMALLSSAADSLLDILMSSGNLVALRHASKPADEDHPYGHGKFETAATLLQSLFIAASGFFILYESIHRLLRGDNQLRHLNIGIAVLVISSIVSWFLSRHLKRVGTQTESTALQADALHYATDVYSNIGLLIGLVGVRILNWNWIDSALSIGVGGYILFAAYKLLKRSMNDFLDAGLPTEQQEKIVRCIEEYKQEVVGYHNLRTRRSGKQKMIDFHLTICRFKTIQEAHESANKIEQLIKDKISNADITIHLEPSDCDKCREAGHQCTYSGKSHEVNNNPDTLIISVPT